jgi:3-hydroxyacyl-CoA dehydrogenase
VFALGGYKVTLHDVSEDVLTRAQKLISEVFHTLAEAGALPPSSAALNTMGVYRLINAKQQKKPQRNAKYA